MTTMIKEKDFEDILCKYPELIEEGLVLRGRQVTLYGRRLDILFEDRFKRRLIVELKLGPIKDEHIGQILSYEGILLSAEDPSIRVMLVGNRVPPNIKRSLDHHGIAWKEITLSELKEFIKEKRDDSFIGLFEDTAPIAVQREQTPVRRMVNTSSERPVSISNPGLYTRIKNRLLEMKVQEHSKYTIEQILEKQKVESSAGDLLLKFHEEFSRLMRLKNLPLITRTNDRGLTYLCNQNKGFIFLSVNQRMISLRFFTGDSKIEELRKGLWVNGNDNLGSENFRVVDDNALQRAIEFAIMSYDIALSWSK